MRYAICAAILPLVCAGQNWTFQAGGCAISEAAGANAFSARCGDPVMQRAMDGFSNDCYRSADPGRCMEKYLPRLTTDIDFGFTPRHRATPGGFGSIGPPRVRNLNPAGGGLWEAGQDAEPDCTNSTARRTAIEAKIARYREALAQVDAGSRDIAAFGAEGRKGAYLGSLAGVFTATKGAADAALGAASLANPGVNALRERYYNKAKAGVELFTEEGAGRTLGNASKLAGEFLPANVEGNNPFALKTAGSGVKAIANAVDGRHGDALMAACDALASGAEESGVSKLAGSRMSAVCDAAGGVKSMADGARMTRDSISDAGAIGQRTESLLRQTQQRRRQLAIEIERSQQELRALDACAPALKPNL